jgi:hypothetical protein
MVIADLADCGLWIVIADCGLGAAHRAAKILNQQSQSTIRNH